MPEILLAIGLLLLFAKLFGLLIERFGMPSLIGELGAGIVLGPVLGFVSLGGFLDFFTMLGIILLLFLGGLEVKFEDIRGNIYSAAALATAAGLLSFFLGVLVGMIFFSDIVIGMAIGTVLVSTSNSTLFVILERTGQFTTRLGRMIIAITIADDIVGILALSLFSVYVTYSNVDVSGLAHLFLISIGLYLFMFTAGAKIIKGILFAFGKFRDEHILFSMPIAVAFILAFFTQNLGLSMAAGAFLAGMTMSNSHYASAVIGPKVRILGFGFVVPLFYAAIGTLLVATELNILLIIAILLAALVGKYVGAGMLSRYFGFKPEERRFIGIMMMPRSNENIALAQLVFLLGIISTALYSSIIYAMVITIILTPLLLKMFYRG